MSDEESEKPAPPWHLGMTAEEIDNAEVEGEPSLRQVIDDLDELAQIGKTIDKP